MRAEGSCRVHSVQVDEFGQSQSHEGHWQACASGSPSQGESGEAGAASRAGASGSVREAPIAAVMAPQSTVPAHVMCTRLNASPRKPDSGDASACAGSRELGGYWHRGHTRSCESAPSMACK